MVLYIIKKMVKGKKIKELTAMWGEQRGDQNPERGRKDELKK